MANISSETTCSFCGKSHTEISKLIAGPGVYICDRCIIVCKKILDKEMCPDEEKTLGLVPMSLREIKDRLEILSVLYRDKIFSKKDYQERVDKILLNL